MSNLNPLTAVTAPDPYPYYAELIAKRPFHWDAELCLWVAASAEAVEQALTNAALRVRPASEPVPRGIEGTEVGEIFSAWARMTDGGAHDLARAAGCAHIDAINFQTLDENARLCALELAGLDLHTFLYSFAPLALAKTMGLQNAAAQWTRALVASVTPSASEADRERGCEAVECFRCAFAKVGISERNTVANAIALFFQTYEATAALIGNVLLAFAKGDASPAMPLLEVIAEVSRHDPPVQNTRRFATNDTRLLHQTIKEGDAILVLLAAANHDSLANPDPHCFQIQREDRRTYTFGVGPHACPGARIATTIAQVAVEYLIASGTQFEHGSAAYRCSPNIRMPILQYTPH